MPKDPAIEGTRKFLMRYSNDNQDRFNREMNSLQGKEYCLVYLSLLEYCVPKLNRSEISITDEPLGVLVPGSEDETHKLNGH